ncbi:LXG domain of WXG superfamily protein [Bhargavaea beijingensis]|uniref:LXG domain of WXG superfamily protein n=1 Tax=Bhargavaea beijingensis TaxID=426756 RepID=A0A1G6Z739_9BACL|nr:LXG domain of WXG superfamily protein [Bhargavaea beijingensis]
MKVLDAPAFEEGLARNKETLNLLESEMTLIMDSVRELVQLNEALKGQGGDAIRRFYQECHLPFLEYFLLFKENFHSTLAGIESAADALEPAPDGYIDEGFIESEVENGLNQIARISSNLTDETNAVMDQVADIVSLPHLDDSQVQEGVLDARRDKNRTVSDLNEFDATQTNRLMPVSDQLQAMEQWIAQIESLFQSGLTGVDFPTQQWAAVVARSPLQQGLAHQSATMDSVNGLNGMENPQNVLYNGRNLGSSTLEGITPESLMTAPNAAIGNSTEKPEAESQNGFLKVAKDLADFALLDDLETITDKDSSLLQKGIAIFGMTPMGKGVKAGKLGFKLVKETPVGKWFKTDANNTALKGKRHYTATEVAQIQQRNAIKYVESGKTKLKNNQQKGNYGEMKMDVHYESQGYNRISRDRVTKLDQPIAKGIDGVYENSSPPPKFVIAEAKYNKSRLKNLKDGRRQMDDIWVSDRLENAIGKQKTKELNKEKLLNPNNVRKDLVKVSKEGKTDIKHLNKDGFKEME